MLEVITGGSGSGKSAWAEQRVLQAGPGRRVYIATMIPYGEEGRARVLRHRKLRAEKHFETVECYTGLLRLSSAEAGPENQAVSTFHFRPDDLVLLECMSNLVANELFEPDGAKEAAVSEILAGVDALCARVRRLFVVTNEVFSDGIVYDPDTLRYMRALGEVNCGLARRAACVTEVVYGIPVRQGAGRASDGRDRRSDGEGRCADGRDRRSDGESRSTDGREDCRGEVR